ncbi:MAG: hypothetical protein QOJ02_760 [Acidobacteriota bacterium]|nr:hypothetical protein [Acidobacteriota bacterium]
MVLYVEFGWVRDAFCDVIHFVRVVMTRLNKYETARLRS